MINATYRGHDGHGDAPFSRGRTLGHRPRRVDLAPLHHNETVRIEDGRCPKLLHGDIAARKRHHFLAQHRGAAKLRAHEGSSFGRVTDRIYAYFLNLKTYPYMRIEDNK